MKYLTGNRGLVNSPEARAARAGRQADLRVPPCARGAVVPGQVLLEVWKPMSAPSLSIRQSLMHAVPAELPAELPTHPTSLLLLRQAEGGAFAPEPGRVTAAAENDVVMLTRASSLTRCEARVALLLAERLSNREIATVLDVTEHTARRHTEKVLRKLGLHRRGAVRDAVRGVVSRTAELPWG